MSATPRTPGGHPTWGRVEIRVKGHLEPRWSDWLDGLTLTCDADGTTLIEGPVIDQAALFGVIDRLRDLALPLISIRHVEPYAALRTTTTHRPSPTQDPHRPGQGASHDNR